MNMKAKQNRGLFIIIICCMILFSLAGCGAGADAGSGEQANVDAGADIADGASPDGSSGAQSVPAAGRVHGISAENYPKIDGSTANMPLIAKLYSEVNGVSLEEAETLIRVSSGTAAAWQNMTWDGGADLLIVYEAPEYIKEFIEEQGVSLEIEPLGRDGLVFLVNKTNTIDNIQAEQLRDIYTGKITDWSAAGGEAGPITAFQRNEDSGSQALFLKLLMGETKPMKPPTELEQTSMGGLIEAVSGFDGAGGAIGYSVYYYAELMYANPDIKLLSVDGVSPSSETIKNGEYSLTNDFYVVIKADEPEGSPARLLRDWLLSDAGAQLLEDAEYIPVR